MSSTNGREGVLRGNRPARSRSAFRSCGREIFDEAVYNMMEDEALYVISVASRLLAMHPQTLRKYERAGFVAPSRTSGKLRLYSPEDIQRLRQVNYLVKDAGVNLAGVEIALEVTNRLRRLLYRAENRQESADRLRQEVEQTCREILKLLGAPVESNRGGYGDRK